MGIMVKVYNLFGSGYAGLGNPKYYGLLQPAYNDATGGAVIQAKGVSIADNLIINQAKTVTIKGGFDPDFTSQGGCTVLQGSLTISQGSLVIDHFAIR